MKRLWVTGHGGFVGSHVVNLADTSWDIHGLSRRDLPVINDRAQTEHVDLLDEKAVVKLFQAQQPQVVIHCAAHADIDYCQQNQDAATALNVDVVALLTKLCGESGSRLVHCSTDTVFDGAKGMYKEDDAPNPVNFYGETKARAEAIVSDLPGSIVVRIPLVMGLTAMGTGTTFLPKLLRNAEAGESTAFPENEMRTPIDVITLANALLELAGREETGILHLAGNSRLNRFEMGKQIADQLGLPPHSVEAVNSNALEGRAPRPDDVSLDNSKARGLLDTPMVTLADGLALILQQAER